MAKEIEFHQTIAVKGTLCINIVGKKHKFCRKNAYFNERSEKKQQILIEKSWKKLMNFIKGLW